MTDPVPRVKIRQDFCQTREIRRKLSATRNSSTDMPGQVLVSTDRVFGASLVPETCPNRFIDSRGLINKFLESRLTGHLRTGTHMDG